MLEKILFSLALLITAGVIYLLYQRGGENKKIWKPLTAIFFLWLFILILVGLVKFGSLLAFLMVFPWIAGKIAETTGMNIWLSYILGVPLSFFLIYALTLALSWNNPRKRLLGLIMMAGTIIVACAIMFFVEKNYVFDPVSTKVKKHYGVTLNGYIEVPLHWEITPWGSPIIRDRERIKEIALSKLIEKQGLPRADQVEIFEKMRIITPDGRPLYWYYQYPDGKIDLFKLPGRHPQIPVMLSPINWKVFSQALKNKSKKIHISSPDSINFLGGLTELRNALSGLKPKE